MRRYSAWDRNVRKCVSPGAGAGTAGQGLGRAGAAGEEEEEGSGRRRVSAAVEIALSAATWLCATILHAGPAGGVGHSVRGCAGGGALGAAGGAAGGSGAALAHAPGPGAVQLPRPQLALLRARPCTSLLNRPEGRGPRWEAPPLVGSTPCRPGPSAPLSVSVLAVEATPARPFAHTRSLRAEAPFPDLATYLSADTSIKVSGPTPKPPGRFSHAPLGPGASTFFSPLWLSDFCRQAL